MTLDFTFVLTLRTPQMPHSIHPELTVPQKFSFLQVLEHVIPSLCVFFPALQPSSNVYSSF